VKAASESSEQTPQRNRYMLFPMAALADEDDEED
jgi:hypothetical protein